MKIGDKVVKVKTKLPSGLNTYKEPQYTLLGPVPQYGQIFVIQKVLYHISGEIGLSLIGHTVFVEGLEVGWNSREFRLLEELKKENQQSHNHQT